MKYLVCVYIAVLILALPAIGQERAERRELIYTPDSSVAYALADLATVPPEDRKYIRYLSLYNIPKERRAAFGQTVSFVVNSLSTRKKMYIPVFVGGSNQTVIRLNIYDYEWESKTWDKLARKGSGPNPQPEPYFHYFKTEIEKKMAKRTVKKKVKKVKPYYYRNQYGQLVSGEQEVTEEVNVEEDYPVGEESKRIFAPALWLTKYNITKLCAETEAESPIIRADWFIVNATWPPAYHDFLRIGKTRKEFQKLVNFEEDRAKTSRAQDKGIVISSMVAKNNRTLIRSPAFSKGYYWASHDSLKSVDDRQYVKNLLNEKFDATEDIGSLPNGLQAYFVGDDKGNRQDFANPDVAIDNNSYDRIVRTGRSCIICHAEGIKPIDDEVRSLYKKYKDRENLKLLVPKKEDYYVIEDLFGGDLDKQIIKDQNYYSEAVAAATGLTAPENAKQYAKIWDEYQVNHLTKDMVAREVGMSIHQMDKYIKQSNDNVVLGLTRNPIRAVRRDQWERSFQDLMLIVVVGLNHYKK